MSEKKSILEEAQSIIHGDRNRDYGHPLDNHTTTAEMWTAYIFRKHGVRVNFDYRDVCHMNILQKISRDANAPKRDTLVDICGFAGNIEMAEDEDARRVRENLNSLEHPDALSPSDFPNVVDDVVTGPRKPIRWFTPDNIFDAAGISSIPGLDAIGQNGDTLHGVPEEREA